MVFATDRVTFQLCSTGRYVRLRGAGNTCYLDLVTPCALLLLDPGLERLVRSTRLGKADHVYDIGSYSSVAMQTSAPPIMGRGRIAVQTLQPNTGDPDYGHTTALLSHRTFPPKSYSPPGLRWEFTIGPPLTKLQYQY